MALTEKEARILMEPDGFWRETIQRDFIGDQSASLRSIASHIPGTMINVARLNSAETFGVHLQLKAGHALLFTRLSDIKLSTFFSFSDDKKFVYPCWTQNNPSDFRASFLWTVPFNMGLYFVMMLAPPADARDYGPTDYRVFAHGAQVKFYLLAVAGPKAGGFWRLPLCNIYEDSSICMGTYTGDHPQADAITRLGLAIDHFRASIWNSHLFDQQKASEQMALFSFSPKGDYLAPPDNWWTHCKKVNNTNYSDLPLINLYAAGL